VALLFLLSVCILISLKSLILVYVIFELQALCFLIILITNNTLRSIQTTLRFSIINFIASLIVLFGFIRLFIQLNGSDNFLDLQSFFLQNCIIDLYHYE
jgi:formate hydrogenlyase subunit 3/multisubunit Na+/H+ antiporter MnhD subunit